MAEKSKRRVLKIIAIIVALLVAIDLLLVGLLFVPKIQTFVVNNITQTLSDKWGTGFSIEKVRITPTLKIVAHNVTFKDHHNNNMIFSKKVKGRLRSFKLSPTTLNLGDVEFDSPEITLRTYKNEKKINVAIWASHFPKSDSKGKFSLTSNAITIKDGMFVLINDNTRTVFDTKATPDIDYSFFELSEIFLQADDFYIVNDDISMKINDMSFSQYGGFELKNMSGDFRICDTILNINKLKVKTKDSDLDLDLRFSYNKWATYGDFLDSVLISSKIRPSILYLGDVAGFAPAIKGMDEVFYLEADNILGYVSDFTLSKINVGWLADNKISGDISIKDVVHFKNATFDVVLDSANINFPDLKYFTTPGGGAIKSISLLSKLGKTTVEGKFSGNIEQFVADLNAKTAIGPLSAYLETVPKDSKLSFVGNITSNGFNLAKLTSTKALGNTVIDISIDGFLPTTEFNKNSLLNAEAHIYGDVRCLPVLRYPLRNLHLEGDYQNKLYNAILSITDPNILGKAIVQLDISHEEPSLQGSMSLENFAAGEIAIMLPKVDSTNAAGVDKLILGLQENPSVKLSFDNFQVALRGNKIDNVNGFIGCDNIKFRYNEDSLQNERLRLTAINTENVHKFILASNIANATFETSYPLNSVKDTLQNFLHQLLPSIVDLAENSFPISENQDFDPNGYLKLNLKTYNTRPLLRVFYPEMLLAPNTVLKIDIHNDNSNDVAEVYLPFFAIRNKVRLHNFNLETTSLHKESMNLKLEGDSIIVNVGKGNLVFDKLNLRAVEENNFINFDLSWHNLFNSNLNISELKGKADVTNLKDIAISFEPSKVYLKDYECCFNDSNEVRIQPNTYIFDNLVFSTQNSSITVDGEYNTKADSKLTLAMKNVDISLLNPLLDNNLSFGGRLFANLSLNNRKSDRFILGKTIIDEFAMNNSRLGDVFLVAGMNESSDMRFAGGIINANFPIDFNTLSSYNMQTFQDEKNKIANISGTFADKKLSVRAIFDTLKADFLAPFLSSFSENLTGNASGDLSFYASSDSTYFDGVVHVIDAKMNIAFLGTTYLVSNQDIMFDKRGIIFKDMVINDVDGNIATMKGEILHNKFRDMLIDLDIHTNRILALNTPRTANSVFYGKGYVQGDVSIVGDTKELSFVGPNIRTLEGSKIALQVVSANSASETDLIHFKVKEEQDTKKEEVLQSPMALNFDFTFDVTNDADVVLFLESIGGTLNARADGRFRLIYKDELNLYGNLQLHSGDFKISLYDVVNSKFTLVPGGSINFDGPIDDMTVNLSAYKTSKTSLVNIVPTEYLTTGNVNVNAGIRLSGPLMRRIEPTFSFELPNSSSEVQNIFYTAIDTQNTENMTKQFAYFLITNTFMPENMFAGNTPGPSGLSIFSYMVNNMLGNVIDSKVGSFGITYNQATETSSAEYGVKANANILKDKVTMSTSIGYYDDRSSNSAYNNIYGNFAVEYNLNKSGSWKLKAYTYIGERDKDIFYEPTSYNNYTAGVAMSYKKDFDVRNKRKKKNDKTCKKNE